MLNKLFLSFFFVFSAFAMENCQQATWCTDAAVSSDFDLNTIVPDFLTVMQQEVASCMISLTEFPNDLEKLFQGPFFNTLAVFNTQAGIGLSDVKYYAKRCILFLYAPPIDDTAIWDPSYFDNFYKVYTWDDALVDNVKFFKFSYPVLCSSIDTSVPFGDKVLATMVADYGTSDYPGELYSARVEVIEFFEGFSNDDFFFYGSGWEEIGYKLYRGPISDPVDVIKNYRFVFTYEKMGDIEGYITEGIFDAFAAGTVPIYLGASNIQDYIPANCFIDRRDFSSMSDLYAFLEAMTEDEYASYITNIQNFIASPAAQVFSQDTFIQIFAQAVEFIKS